MNIVDQLKELALDNKPKINFVFTEDCVDNRHNRRKQKAKERKITRKNGKYYNKERIR